MGFLFSNENQSSILLHNRLDYLTEHIFDKEICSEFEKFVSGLQNTFLAQKQLVFGTKSSFFVSSINLIVQRLTTKPKTANQSKTK